MNPTGQLIAALERLDKTCASDDMLISMELMAREFHMPSEAKARALAQRIADALSALPEFQEQEANNE